MEQRSQYLEKMIRLEPQGSFLMTSKFDHVRFNGQPDGRNKKAIDNIDNVPKNQRKTTDQLDLCELESSSGFLITDCDEAVTLSIPSPIRSDQISIVSSNENQQQDYAARHGLSTLHNEFELAQTKNRRKRKHRLRKNLKKQANQKLTHDLSTMNRLSSRSISETTTMSNTFCGSTRSDSISISIDTDSVYSQSTSNYADRDETVSRLLKTINQKQRDLRRLKKCVLSLVKPPPIDSSNSIAEESIELDQDVFDAVFNPNLSANQCWLCSGKMYSEASTQTTPVERL